MLPEVTFMMFMTSSKRSDNPGSELNGKELLFDSAILLNREL